MGPRGQGAARPADGSGARASFQIANQLLAVLPLMGRVVLTILATQWSESKPWLSAPCQGTRRVGEGDAYNGDPRSLARRMSTSRPTTAVSP
jgi:hypothetical protein